MTKITNIDTRQSRDAQIITASDNDLGWCIAVWHTPEIGRSAVTGQGHTWQIVREHNGRYTYNGEMMGGVENSLDDVRAKFAALGYRVL